jgi:hypothetical protein
LPGAEKRSKFYVEQGNPHYSGKIYYLILVEFKSFLLGTGEVTQG